MGLSIRSLCRRLPGTKVSIEEEEGLACFYIGSQGGVYFHSGLHHLIMTVLVLSISGFV